MAKEKSASFSTSFRLLGKPQDFREERVGNAVLGRNPNKQRGHRNSPTRALAVPGGGEVCKKPWECVRGVSGAAAPTEPSAGSLAFDDLTRDLAGLGEQSKGGSLIRERRDTSSLMAHGETPA